MKVRKAKRKFEPKPKVQPKRNDMNTLQMSIYNKVLQAPDSLIEDFDAMIGELGVEGLEKSKEGYWHPYTIAIKMGVSMGTVENYIYHYLRVIRRTDENAAQLRRRKYSFVSEECPLDMEMKDGNPIYRWVSSRVFLFLCAAITRGTNHSSGDNLRKIRSKIPDRFGIPLGEPQKIPRHETQVHTFQVKDQ